MPHPTLTPSLRSGPAVPWFSALSLRQRIGLAILAAALLIQSHALWQWLSALPQAEAALRGGGLAALATALGALPVLFSQRLSGRTQDTLLGFGAGVMLAASAFSLVVPGIAAARQLGAGPWQAGATVGASMLLGAGLMMLIDRLLPHEHAIAGADGRAAQTLRRAWLFVFAIALHNLPEGLAIGVGYAGNDALRAGALSAGIAIQDVPEGFVVALALAAAGYGRGLAVAIGAATGLLEPLGALLGVALIGLSAALLPWGLGFAAGAMLFVVSHEIIPESHRKGHEAFATGGLMLGFVVMMLLDTALA